MILLPWQPYTDPRIAQTNNLYIYVYIFISYLDHVWVSSKFKFIHNDKVHAPPPPPEVAYLPYI